MSNPRGNPGNKGGGRKSAYQERADADFLAKMFFEEHTKEEIENMIKENRSISKTMLAKALAGNERFILAVFNKLFPDLSKSEQEHKFDFTTLIKEKQNV